MKILRAIALLIGMAAPAAAGPFFTSPSISSVNDYTFQSISGYIYVANSTTTPTNYTITLNGRTGNVSALSFTGPLTGNVTGNLLGNVTGNVTGNLTGNASGSAGTVTDPFVAYRNRDNDFTTPETFESSATIKGSEFSVGTSALSVTGGNVGIGTATPSHNLEVASNTASLAFDVNGPYAEIRVNGILLIRLKP